MGNMTVTEAVLVSKTARNSNQMAQRLALFNTDGEPVTVFSSESNQVAARADAAAATSTAAAGATPTKAEFDALRNDYLALRTAFNDLLAKMRTANLLDT